MTSWLLLRVYSRSVSLSSATIRTREKPPTRLRGMRCDNLTLTRKYLFFRWRWSSFRAAQRIHAPRVDPAQTKGIKCENKKEKWVSGWNKRNLRIKKKWHIVRKARLGGCEKNHLSRFVINIIISFYEFSCLSFYFHITSRSLLIVDWE